MFKNYFKTGIKNLIRNKGYTLLNLLSLSVGLTVFILVLLFVNYEKSYDNWDQELNRVYRVGVSEENKNGIQRSASIQYPLGTFLRQECPEVEEISRVMVRGGEQLISLENKEFFERKIISADSNFFRLFPYHFVKGNGASALAGLNSMVITKMMSRKLFGNQDPIGRRVTVNLRNEYTITGVIEKQGPSHLDFDICMSYHSRHFAGNWFMKNQDTYVLLKPHSNLKALSEKASTIYGKNYALSYGSFGKQKNNRVQEEKETPVKWLAQEKGIRNLSVFFEPVHDIHINPIGYLPFYSQIGVYDFNKANQMPVYVFSLIGFLILLLACINYTNLSIALAGGRLKGSGIRKIMGASRKQLIFQYLAESLIVCLLSLVMALFMAGILENMINNAFGSDLHLWNSVNPDENKSVITQLFIILMLTTVVSGIFPAFMMSKYSPLNIVRGDIFLPSERKWVRNGLVIFQFVIASGFIIAVSTIFLQLKFMQQSDSGFHTDQVLRIENTNTYLFPGQPGDRSKYIVENIGKIPGVEIVTTGENYPGMSSRGTQEATYDGNKILPVSFGLVNYDYFRTLGMKIVEGRSFSTSYGMDSVNAAVINQTAVAAMGWENPVGKRFDLMDKVYRVIGVVKDARLTGYSAVVEPEVYMIGVGDPRNFGGHSQVFVKIDGNDIKTTLSKVVSFWKSIEPKFPVRYSWLDQDYARLFAKYDQFGKLIGFLTFVAIAIAGFGLLALSAYAAKHRYKEIGIRKVLGASVKNIVLLLSKNFLLLVLFAFAIAIPIALWIMSIWLDDFAYRISIQWWLIGLSGLAVLMISLLSLSYFAIKAALANPVESLRSE